MDSMINFKNVGYCAKKKSSVGIRSLVSDVKMWKIYVHINKI